MQPSIAFWFIIEVGSLKILCFFPLPRKIEFPMTLWNAYSLYSQLKIWIYFSLQLIHVTFLWFRMHPMSGMSNHPIDQDGWPIFLALVNSLHSQPFTSCINLKWPYIHYLCFMFLQVDWLCLCLRPSTFWTNFSVLMKIEQELDLREQLLREPICFLSQRWWSFKLGFIIWVLATRWGGSWLFFKMPHWWEDFRWWWNQ